MAAEESPSTSGGCSSSVSSGCDGNSFVMVDMTSSSSSPPGSDDTDGHVPHRIHRSHSCSSIDSSVSEAKFGHIHGLDFDFLLWFCQKNEMEADLIFRVLEKEQSLRGYREDRDQTAGRYKISNVSEAIKRSWKILLLVSPEALAENWFENKMHQSLTHDINESKGHVIPILLGAERKDLPTYLSSIYSLTYPSPSEAESGSDTTTSGLYQDNSSTESELDRFIKTLISIFAGADKASDRKQRSTSRSTSRSSDTPSASSQKSQSDSKLRKYFKKPKFGKKSKEVAREKAENYGPFLRS